VVGTVVGNVAAGNVCHVLGRTVGVPLPLMVGLESWIPLGPEMSATTPCSRASVGPLFAQFQFVASQLPRHPADLSSGPWKV
jgi:hypothetical protein